VQSAGFIGVFPLVFASSVFVPTTTMPDWLQAFADISPVTVSADAARALSIGGDAATPVLQTLLWTIGILAVFIPLCVWRYRRMG
jgi:ABC-2 type transport system permease protein/oleandomycin transport system permease protein